MLHFICPHENEQKTEHEHVQHGHSMLRFLSGCQATGAFFAAAGTCPYGGYPLSFAAATGASYWFFKFLVERLDADIFARDKWCGRGRDQLQDRDGAIGKKSELRRAKRTGPTFLAHARESDSDAAGPACAAAGATRPCTCASATTATSPTATSCTSSAASTS